MFKKTLALALSLVLSASLFTGCLLYTSHKKCGCIFVNGSMEVKGSSDHFRGFPKYGKIVGIGNDFA